MSAQHTPGPWIAAVGGDVVLEKNHNRIIACTMRSGLYSHPASLAKAAAEREANARLIAAAPELLDALKAMVAQYPAFRSKPVGAPGSAARKNQEHQIRIEDEALAAIAKAAT